MLTSWVLASYEIQIHVLATHELVIHIFGSVFDRKGVDSVEAQIIVAGPLDSMGVILSLGVGEGPLEHFKGEAGDC